MGDGQEDAYGPGLPIRFRRIRVRSWAPVAALGAVAAALALFSGLAWLGFVTAGLMLGALAFQVVFSWSRNRLGPLMFVGRMGLTVRGYPTVPWADIDHLRIGWVENPGLKWLARAFARAQYGKVVAFVPREGVHMPPPPGALRDRESWREARMRIYGTNLTVVTGIMNVGADEIVGECQRWTSLRVVER